MISVIIPALNESRALPAMLNRLFMQSGEFEVILVDGGSIDETVACARLRPTIRILSSRRGRALQMNTGAAVARGNILLFLHADTVLPDGAIADLNAFELVPSIQWGGFHQRFSGSSWVLRTISRMHNWRCERTGIIYGDQAMFVRRKLFSASGGFPADPILEDVRLSERLLRWVSPTILPSAVVTDSRKFEQMGPLRSFLRCLLILTCYELRLPILGRGFFAAIR